MLLQDLDPKLTENQLRFKCPACGEHYIVIPVDRKGLGAACPPVWTARGDLPQLSITPSIDARTPPCRWHGWITSGAVTTC